MVTDPHSNIVMANKDPGKSEMIEGKCNSAHENSTINYLRRCNKKQKRLTTNIDSLPDDLVFKILANLPAQDVYKRAMLVCRNWYRMVHSRAFIHEHLQNSPRGLLFTRAGWRDVSTFVAIRQGRIEIYKFPQILLAPVSASCNGLILLLNCYNGHLYITNPITRQELCIPSHPPQGRSFTFFHHCSLGYSPSTMEYKAVIWYQDLRMLIKCFVFTVGVDKSWREVCTQHISKVGFHFNRALLTQGFIHWYSDTHIMTLNLETEIMTHTPIPPDVINNNYLLNGRYHFPTSVKSKYYLPTPEKSLSLLVWVSQLCWDIWEMRSETGEWTKWGKIDLAAKRRILYRLRRRENEQVGGPMVLVPAGWLEYREVLVFFFAYHSYNTRVFIVYHIRTQEIDSFDLDYPTAAHFAHLHTNSLEWLAPCI